MDGTPYRINGREFIVPRLRVLSYERAALAIRDANEAEGDPMGVERIHAACLAIQELLRENHPELTVEEVKGLLYMDEVDSTLAGVLQAAGRKKAPPGEAPSP